MPLAPARLLAALVPLLALPALAQTSAGHRVTIEVPDVELLAVTSADVRLTFDSAEPGGGFADVTDGSARYAVTVNTVGNKIVGSLDGAFPEGVRLWVELAPPAGASGLGRVELAASGRDLVADLTTVAASGLPITYTASADAAALGGPLTEARTVTYTITDQ